MFDEARVSLGEFTVKLETDTEENDRSWWDGDLWPAVSGIGTGDVILLRFADGTEAEATAHSPVERKNEAPFIPIDGLGRTPF